MTCEHCGVRLDVGALICPDCGREQRGGAVLSPAAPPDAPVAHDEPCPKHPALPVAGTCPRCGTFVCIRCAPGAASGVLTCNDCLARAREQYAIKPSPFGGPLVFPLLGLVLKTFVFVSIVVIAVTLGGDVRAVLPAASVLLTIPAFVGFLRRSRWTPRLLVALYALDAAIAVMGWRPASIAWIGWSIGWSAYFLVSRRSKETFTGR